VIIEPMHENIYHRRMDHNNSDFGGHSIRVTAFIWILIFLLTCTGSLFADKEFYLPDDRRMLINEGPEGRIIHAEILEHEIVDKGNEIWCELMSGVRTNFYVTLVFDKNVFESNYNISREMNISCIVTGVVKEEHEVPAGSIATYFLECEPLGNSMNNTSDVAEPKIYHIFDVTYDADFDTPFMENIDNQMVPYPENSAFQIGDFPLVSGEYSLYKFICTYWGNSALADSKQIYHDLLVIKTDELHIIQEAYHYTMEWSDSPSLDLYHVTNVDATLSSDLNVEDLGLYNVNFGLLVEEAFLDNVFFATQLF
jgi:hypothetical protein